MTGNRITVSFDNYYELGRDRYTGWAGTGISPTTPGVQFPGSELVPPDYYFENGLDYYTKRNNVRLPAYHRLDLGINIYKPLKKRKNRNLECKHLQRLLLHGSCQHPKAVEMG